ncbi:MAG TPA: division/cell wall cluster transcriptional repressor MraZ [Bacteroidetes bacterium]|nr:division/cell wall cluster transcriptional repressor MraZ [Bacteroidota bacterium]
MATFIGDFTCKVDAKGRVMLPSTFKRQLPAEAQDTFVVKKDIFEQCLVLYPLHEWERQNQIIRERINPYRKDHNRFLRNFYRGAAELVLDGSNRILIPRRLLAEVGIDKEVVLAGQDSRIEIWPAESYGRMEESEDEFASLAEKIMGGRTSEQDV